MLYWEANSDFLFNRRFIRNPLRTSIDKRLELNVRRHRDDRKLMKKLLGNTALVLFSSIVSALLLEFAIWLSPNDLLPAQVRHVIEGMESRVPNYWRADPYLRGVIRPGTDFPFVGEEFSFRIKTNLNFPDAGFRGGTLGGPVWGVALGDSFTFGCCVDQEDTWVDHLARLSKNEIANLGIPGHGPAQYTRVLEKYGLSLKPKVAFYGLYANDLADSIDFEQWLNGREKRMGFRRFAKHHSVVYHLIRSLRRADRPSKRRISVDGTGIKVNRKKLADPYEIGSHGFDGGWALTKREIIGAIEQSKRIGATFVLLYFPSKEEVYRDLIEDGENSLRSFKQERDRFMDATRRFCDNEQLHCLDLTPALKKRALNREDIYFPRDIHWNEEGNRIVSEEIYRFGLDKKIF